MSFILGSLVSAPSVAAPQGEPFMFLQEEIDALNDLIMKLQDENRILHFEQTDLATGLSVINNPELEELAVWKIEKDSNFEHDVSTVLYDTTVYGKVKKPSSSCDMVIGWFKSKDVTFSTTGMHWRSILTIEPFTTTFDVKARSTPQAELRSENNFIAFGTRNFGTCSSSGDAEDFSGTMTIHLPPGQSLVKLP